jgi:transcriptional regulator with XRE-family HTH domain
MPKLYDMTPPAYIRKIAFGMTQRQFADALALTPGAISQWETAGRVPSRYQQAVRSLASDMGKIWSDSWFFETPED